MSTNETLGCGVVWFSTVVVRNSGTPRQITVRVARNYVVVARNWGSLARKHVVVARNWGSLARKHVVVARNWGSLARKHAVAARISPLLRGNHFSPGVSYFIQCD
ncbi:hypothetical protein Len3610_11210 [Lentibacillus sp. CBA3610]|nr:hypothetical protein Len3610_11210 [Lentibacillus sp. CBA3610]